MGCRFKQGWVERPGTSEDGGRHQSVSQHGSSPRSTASFSNNQETQYLRLPVCLCNCHRCDISRHHCMARPGIHEYLTVCRQHLAEEEHRLLWL